MLYFLGDSSTVAFTASSDNLHDSVTDQIIVFSNIITNIGNDYDSSTGVFRCRVSGVYLFFVYLLTERGVHASAYLAKNNVRKIIIYSPLIPHQLGPDSNMVVLRLQIGDIVTVRSTSNYNGATYDSDSTFSGVLISQMF